MFARVVSVRSQLDKLDEGIAITRLMEASWQEQRGFQGATLLVERDTGQVILISNWASRADLEASEASGWYQQQVDKFKSAWVAPPERTIFEVAVQVAQARAVGGA